MADRERVWPGAGTKLPVVGLVGVILSGAGCQREEPPPGVVARVGERLLHVREVEAEMAERAPGFRSKQYEHLDKREALLDSMVRFELLAKEAERRGYGRDPEVLRSTQRQMVAVMLRKEIDQKLGPSQLPQREVERLYRERLRELQVPEQVQVSQILLNAKDVAERVAALARQARRPNVDEDRRNFRELVLRFSEDPASRIRGGALGTLTANSASIPREVLTAALALREPGELSPIVRTSQGFHLLKLIERRAASVRPLEEVRTALLEEVRGTQRAARVEELVTTARKRTEVVIFKDRLGEVRIPSRPSTAP